MWVYESEKTGEGLEEIAQKAIDLANILEEKVAFVYGRKKFGVFPGMNLSRIVSECKATQEQEDFEEEMRAGYGCS